MTLVGREREQTMIADALQRVTTRSTVITVEAEAGAGKTTLLEAAVDAALDRGFRILRCRPTATEAQLAYAALGDLLATVDDLTALDPVPHVALERALLRGRIEPADERGTTDVEPRSVAHACVGVIQHLADAMPVLIVVDDTQWLDAASAAAIAFTIRRLPGTGVVALCARRLGETSIEISGQALAVPPLTADAVMTILTGRTRHAGRPLSRRDLRRIVDVAGGNPLFAIELARAAESAADMPTSGDATRTDALRTDALRADALRADGSVVVPASLAEVIDRRFGALDPETTDALAAVAMLARPDLAVVHRLGIASAVEQAELDGLVDTSTGRVAFAHPLFAAAVLERVPASRRRRLHRRLAAAVEAVDGSDSGDGGDGSGEPDGSRIGPAAPAVTSAAMEAIRHAALGAEGPDARLADRLAATAESLVSRGAIDHAADFAQLAVTLSPADDPARPARCASAAHLAFQRGETEAAAVLLALVDRSVASPEVMVRERLVRAKIAFSTTGSSEATRFATEALDHCATDAERIEVHSILSRVTYDHFPTAAEHAAIALDLIERTEVSPAVLASALVASAGTRCMIGLGLDRGAYERAIELERHLPGYTGDSAYASLAAWLKVVDDFDESRRMFLRLLSDNDGDGALPYALSHLPQLELWSGHWDAAEEYAAQHLEASLRTGQHEQVAQATNNLAIINTYRGDVDEAAVLAERLIENARAGGDAWTERSGLGLLGLVALANGDAERAVELLGRWHDIAEQMGLHEPGYCRLRIDLVEALVATGRIDQADELAARMHGDAERLDRPSLRAIACRGRALVAAARGEHQHAVALATDAVAWAAATPLVVEHARSLLTLGQIHRRFKEKAAAKVALQASLDIFERLGAERFAERARQDLARIGLRPPAAAGLTETERRVAEVAATGKTVRQVGAELFISPKTVEANLTRVYRKLGISGRAELATWLAARPAADAGADAPAS